MNFQKIYFYIFTFLLNGVLFGALPQTPVIQPQSLSHKNTRIYPELDSIIRSWRENGSQIPMLRPGMSIWEVMNKLGVPWKIDARHRKILYPLCHRQLLFADDPQTESFDLTFSEFNKLTGMNRKFISEDSYNFTSEIHSPDIGAQSIGWTSTGRYIWIKYNLRNIDKNSGVFLIVGDKSYELNEQESFQRIPAVLLNQSYYFQWYRQRDLKKTLPFRLKTHSPFPEVVGEVPEFYALLTSWQALPNKVSLLKEQMPLWDVLNLLGGPYDIDAAEQTLLYYSHCEKLQIGAQAGEYDVILKITFNQNDKLKQITYEKKRSSTKSSPAIKQEDFKEFIIL